uniref:Uncharacterized protein n=1 Tax=Ditylenchus dipsaci TaxID=166011 RepID=A0A915EN65_9BILA
MMSAKKWRSATCNTYKPNKSNQRKNTEYQCRSRPTTTYTEAHLMLQAAMRELARPITLVGEVPLIKTPDRQSRSLSPAPHSRSSAKANISEAAFVPSLYSDAHLTVS